MTQHNPECGLDCVSAGVTTLGKTSPAEKRRKPDFHCDACGEEWDVPGHMFWLGYMRCVCGEVVEAK